MTIKLTKTKELPPAVFKYFASIVGAEKNVAICDKYGIADNDIIKNTNLVADLFYKNIKIADLVSEIKNIFGFDDKKASNMAIDIVGIRLLPVKDWFSENLEEYIKNLGGNIADYFGTIKEQEEAVKKEEADLQKELEPEKEYVPQGPKIEEVEVEEKKVDKKREIEDSVSVFKESLVNILEMKETQYFNDLNNYLLELIIDNPQIKISLENALRSNQEILTKSKLITGDHEQSPTIANWLKDFVSKNGSGMFDNIVLADYLANSVNAKKLNKDEKKPLERLSRLYRNLKFFPESMNGIPPERWEIMPIDADEKEDNLAKASSRANNDRLARLQTLAQQYPEGSLERRAIEEEIRKENFSV